jgi:uncharacterized membrane protein
MATDRIMEAVDQYLAALREAAGAMPAVEREEFMNEIRSHILDHMEAEKDLTEDGIHEILRRVGDPQRLAAQLATQAMLRPAAKSMSPWVLFRSTLRWAMTGFAGVVVFLVTLLGYGIQEIRRRVGDPRRLAAQLARQAVLPPAAKSMSPRVLFRTTLRWAMTGLAGVVVFLVTLSGYGCAAVSGLVVLLKPVFPDRIGLWLAPEHTLTLGFWDGRLVRSVVYGISVGPSRGFLLGALSSTYGPVRDIAGQDIYLIGVACAGAFVVATTVFVRWAITRFGLRNRRFGSSQPASHGEPRYAG